MNYRENLKNQVDVFQQNVNSNLENLEQTTGNNAYIQRVRYFGMQDALERFVIQIGSISGNESLVPPESPIIGVPQYLTTDDIFLNAAYFQAILIRDEPRGVDGSVAGSPEGEKGKVAIMNQIMDYIRGMC